MNIEITEFSESFLGDAVRIWNEVVEQGVAFPQEEFLTADSGREFFEQQSFTGIALADGKVKGLYILHPNNVGRCGHICNASYAVDSSARGMHIGEALVTHCIRKAGELGYGILQFNAVVASNTAALHLYEKLGFTRLGTIPHGFRLKSGEYESIIPHYIELNK